MSTRFRPPHYNPSALAQETPTLIMPKQMVTLWITVILLFSSAHASLTVKVGDVVSTDSGFYLLKTVLDVNGLQASQSATFVTYIDERKVDETNDLNSLSAGRPIGYLPEGSVVEIFACDAGVASLNAELILQLEDQEIVASFREEFQLIVPATGWEYLWNAPDGFDPNVVTDSGLGVTNEIGVPSNYKALVWNSFNQAYRPFSQPNSTDNQAKTVSLSDQYVSPGVAYDQSSSAWNDRYAIVAYEVPSSGFYAIKNSYFQSGKSSTSEILIHVEDYLPILRQFSSYSDGAVSFDTNVGYLESGKKIYVCVGPNLTWQNENAQLDFQIVKMSGSSISEQIVNRSNSTVRIYPTRYYADTNQIRIVNTAGLTIDGTGALYLLNDSGEKYVYCYNADSTLIKGFHFDYSHINFFQGDVLSINGRQLLVRPHRGFMDLDPNSSSSYSKVIAHNASDQLWKVGSKVTRISSITETGTNYLLDVADDPIGWAVGDCISFSRKGSSSFSVSHSSQFEFKNMKICQWRGWCFSSFKNESPIFDGVELSPGSRPLLAYHDRLRSGDKDGFNISATSAPVIQNCLIEGNADDSIHVWGTIGMVLESTSNSNKVEITSRLDVVEVGETILIDYLNGRVEATIVGVEESGVSAADAAEKSLSYFGDSDSDFRSNILNNPKKVILCKSVTVPEGSLVSLPNRSGQGLIIRNNVIRNNPGRGILVKCRNGLVENNLVQHLGGPAVKLELETKYWGSGGPSLNTTIRGNYMENVAADTLSSSTRGKSGAIIIERTGEGGARHEFIDIENNVFKDIYGLNILISDAKRVKLSGNAFINPGYLTSQGGANVDPEIQNGVVYLNNVYLVSLSDSDINYCVHKHPDLSFFSGGGAPSSGSIHEQQSVTLIDTDGDGVDDFTELLSGRDPSYDGDFNFEFNDAQEAFRWAPLASIANYEIVSGVMRGVVAAYNGEIRNGYFSLDTAKVPAIVIRAKVDQLSDIGITYRLEGDSNWYNLTLPHLVIDQFYDYVFPLQGWNWSGNMNLLQLHPARDAGTEFEIDSISISN